MWEIFLGSGAIPDIYSLYVLRYTVVSAVVAFSGEWRSKLQFFGLDAIARKLSSSCSLAIFRCIRRSLSKSAFMTSTALLVCYIAFCYAVIALVIVASAPLMQVYFLGLGAYGALVFPCILCFHGVVSSDSSVRTSLPLGKTPMQARSVALVASWSHHFSIAVLPMTTMLLRVGTDENSTIVFPFRRISTARCHLVVRSRWPRRSCAVPSALSPVMTCCFLH